MWCGWDMHRLRHTRVVLTFVVCVCVCVCMCVWHAALVPLRVHIGVTMITTQHPPALVLTGRQLGMAQGRVIARAECVGKGVLHRLSCLVLRCCREPCLLTCIVPLHPPFIQSIFQGTVGAPCTPWCVCGHRDVAATRIDGRGAPGTTAGTPCPPPPPQACHPSRLGAAAGHPPPRSRRRRCRRHPQSGRASPVRCFTQGHV